MRPSAILLTMHSLGFKHRLLLFPMYTETFTVMEIHKFKHKHLFLWGRGEMSGQLSDSEYWIIIYWDSL